MQLAERKGAMKTSQYYVFLLSLALLTVGLWMLLPRWIAWRAGAPESLTRLLGSLPLVLLPGAMLVNAMHGLAEDGPRWTRAVLITISTVLLAAVALVLYFQPR